MYRSFVIIGIIGLFLILVSHLWPIRLLKSGASFIIEPVLAAETRVTGKTVGWLTLIRSIKDMNNENRELRRKNIELEAKIASFKEVSHENQILRQELQFAEVSHDHFITAELIGQTPTGIIKDLIIDRGQRDGITIGQIVMAQGYLVGQIVSVDSERASVRLLTHPKSLVPVILQDSRSTGILRGGIGGLTVTDLLIDAPINQNEVVLTSGLGGQIPEGIPIGKVIESNARKGDITKKATIHSPLDITKLELVFIRKAE